MRRLSLFALAFFLVNFGWAFLPRFETFAEAGKTHCPDGYAYMMPKDYPTAGQYVRCEDFDSFFALLAEGKKTEAEALLFR